MVHHGRRKRLLIDRKPLIRGSGGMGDETCGRASPLSQGQAQLLTKRGGGERTAGTLSLSLSLSLERDRHRETEAEM